MRSYIALIVGALILGCGPQVVRAAMVPYDIIASDPNAKSGCQPSLFAETGKKKIAIAMANMKANGLAAIIDQKYGADSEEGAFYKAIAVRESVGLLEGVNIDPKTGKEIASCAFQLYWKTAAVWATEPPNNFPSLAAYQKALKSDPALCLAAGERAWKDKVGAASRVLKLDSADQQTTFALCNYGGESKAYSIHNTCCAAYEYRITAARILGRDFSYVQSNTKSGKFAIKTTIDKQTGKVLAEQFLCKDHTQEFPLAIAKMAQLYQVRLSQTLQDKYAQTLRTYDDRNLQIHQPLGQTMCIDTLTKKYQNLIDYQNKGLKSFVAGIVLQALTTACNYVSTQTNTALNNLLNLACVPVPNLDYMLGVDLPSLGKTTCNGLSLNSLIVQGSSSTSSTSSSSSGETYPEGTLPEVDIYPSSSISGVPSDYTIRQVVPSESSKYYEFDNE